MEDSEEKHCNDLPRTRSLFSQDIRHNCKYFEDYYYGVLPMISEDSVSAVRPDCSESLSGNSRLHQLHEVVSSYKHIKTSLIVICLLDVVLLLFAMIMITVLLIAVSKDWKQNVVLYDNEMKLFPWNKQTVSNSHHPSEIKPNHEIIQKERVPKMNKDIFKEKFEVRCSDINKYLSNTGQQKAEYCTLTDVLRAANKFIVEKVEETINKNEEEANAINVCCNTRPLLQISGTNPGNVVNRLNQFQNHMRKWNVINSQAIRVNSDGEVMIPSEGSFFLYSRLEFRVEGGGMDAQSVSQTIQVKHPDAKKYRDEQVSRHKCPGDKIIHSVSLESVLYLKAGYRLKVVFKFPENVTPKIQYIGIFQI